MTIYNWFSADGSNIKKLVI